MAYKKYSVDFYKPVPRKQYWLNQAKRFHAVGFETSCWACLLHWVQL